MAAVLEAVRAVGLGSQTGWRTPTRAPSRRSGGEEEEEAAAGGEPQGEAEGREDLGPRRRLRKNQHVTEPQEWQQLRLAEKQKNAGVR